jgi:hypothetical protein
LASLHDPNFQRKFKKLESKATQEYRRELFPPEIEEE